jgi:alpha,alpha-trehalase
MRESGFDTSFRFGPFSGSTEDYAPVCLNSLLYKYERDMAHFATLLGRRTEAAEWEHRASARREAINKYLWNPTQGMFYDYNFATQKQSTYNYITAFYPLWAKLATPQQAQALQHHLSLFEHDGGLAMSDNNSGTQWDLPYGWAPTNWLAIDGLAQYGFPADASRTAKKFSQTILQNFLTDATIREKYNVVSGSANVAVATGYKANVVGFGWTNGVYLQMQALLAHQSKQAATLKTSPRNPQPRSTAPSPKDAAVPTQSRMQSHSTPPASDYPPPSISRSAFPSLHRPSLSSPAP